MKIQKILCIKDTRQSTEMDGRVVALAGTGEKNACAICGSLHEIHATVQFDDGSSAIVGIACAKKAAPVVFKVRELEIKIEEQVDKKARLLEENEVLCVQGDWSVWAGTGRFEKLVRFDQFEPYAVRVAPNRNKIKTCLKKIKAFRDQIDALQAE